MFDDSFCRYDPQFRRFVKFGGAEIVDTDTLSVNGIDRSLKLKLEFIENDLLVRIWMMRIEEKDGWLAIREELPLKTLRQLPTIQ